mgnify:CR=1 FL=1
MNPSKQFTDFDVATIRLEYAKGILDARKWADARKCSPETIRRIARGETYRHVGGQTVHHAWGGLTAAPAAPAFQAPQGLPPLEAILADEPDDKEAAASLARLQAALAAPSAEQAQAARAASLLDELRAGAQGGLPSDVDGAGKLG